LKIDFQLSRARVLDLDLRAGHTANRRASLIDLYLQAKFIKIEGTFCGWTDVRMDDGRIFETHFIRSTQKNPTNKTNNRAVFQI